MDKKSRTNQFAAGLKLDGMRKVLIVNNKDKTACSKNSHKNTMTKKSAADYMGMFFTDKI